MRLWRAGQTGLQAGNSLAGHQYTVNCCAFSPGGTLLARSVLASITALFNKLSSGATDGTTRLWDGRTGELIHILHQPR